MLTQATTTTTRTTTSRFALPENFYKDWLLTELFLSYYEARANKRNTHNQIRFERNLSYNLLKLYTDIVEDKYKIGRSTAFIIEKPVKREVFAATFRDRIVHHLFINKIFAF